MYLIVNIDGIDTSWLPHYTLGSPKVMLIPQEHRPTVIQRGTREEAEAELLRLHRLHPGGVFTLFAVAAVAQSVELATHIDINGKPLRSERVGRLVHVELDDDASIPF